MAVARIKALLRTCQGNGITCLYRSFPYWTARKGAAVCTVSDVNVAKQLALFGDGWHRRALVRTLLQIGEEQRIDMRNVEQSPCQQDVDGEPDHEDDDPHGCLDAAGMRAGVRQQRAPWGGVVLQKMHAENGQADLAEPLEQPGKRFREPVDEHRDAEHAQGPGDRAAHGDRDMPP